MVKAYTTAFANLKSWNIRKFKIGYRCKKKDSSLEIPKSAVSYQDGSLFIYKKYLNSKIKKCKEDIPDIKYDWLFVVKNILLRHARGVDY
jgi:hypothetical protein